MPPNLTGLNMLEAGVACQLRSLVQLSPRPDYGVVLTVTAAGRDARLHGVPFSVPAVLAILYPGWTWAYRAVVLQ